MFRSESAYGRRDSKRGRTKKVKGGDSGDIATCWATLYDAFAARYGLTPDKFYEEYTLRQVTYLLRVIDKAKYEDLSVQAKLHGVKLKPRINSLGLSKEQREEADTQAMSVLERMKKNHEDSNG